MRIPSIFIACFALGFLLAASPLSGRAAEAGEGPLGPSCYSPEWSPDGRQIAFSSDALEAGNYDIFVINANGTGLRRLTSDAADDLNPTWKPDGRALAFESTRSGVSQIHTIKVDGSGLAQLTSGPNASHAPAWSPDGSKIAISSARHERQEDDILLISPAGAELGWVTAEGKSESCPAWSPDGKVIAYASDDRIWRRSIDKSSRSRLTTGGNNGHWIESNPTWSRNGQRIAYSAVEVERVGGISTISKVRIYVMNSDGTACAPLFSSEPVSSSSDPSWAPNQDRIAFIGRNSDGLGDEVFTAKADGTGLLQITHRAVTPVFSVRSGTCSTGKKVTITCATTGATIRYTTDGTEPTETSTRYTGPVTIDHSLTLRARTWKTDCFPSVIKSAEYEVKGADSGVSE